MSVELLSPAGDLESLKCAVFEGANAVYFGAKSFNARAKANNFENLLEVTRFCHLYGVKTYLTLNTLIDNNQIEDFLNTAKNALECGIDAFIVQDFGALYLLKNYFKDVEIHASTQMAINNYLGARQAKKHGIKRIVLSREVNLNDIKRIKKETNMELEFFIQGALCVGFSGNCYLSSAIFGKSGNKGECMQPCRLPYTAMLENNEVAKGYLLSAKDICMANRLKELKEAGINSFKIEGRLRRAGYVANVTKTYRKILDNNFAVNEEQLRSIKKAFNRGDFTEGYLNGNDKIIYKNIQGHKGIEIGKVLSVKLGNRFNIIQIKSSHNITRGDVLKFIKNEKEVATITAVDIKKEHDAYIITTTAKIDKDCIVHLILDCSLEESLLSNEKKLPVEFHLTARVGEKLSLSCHFNDIDVVAYGNECNEAVNQPLNEAGAKQQLSKLGNTYFYLSKFSVDIENVFVSKAELNALRNNVTSQVLNHYANKKEIQVNNQILEDNSIVNRLNGEYSLEISSEITSDCDYLVVYPENYQTFDFSKINHNNVFLYIPSFLREEDIELIDKILNENPSLGVYAENLGALEYNRKTILGAKLNIKNIYAIKELMGDNVVAVVASPEIDDTNFEILQKSTDIPVFRSEINNFELMTLVHCPIKTIFNNNCASCKFNKNIKLKMDNGQLLALNRRTIKHCYFNLSKIVDLKKQIMYTRCC